MAQITSLLNGENINQDHQITALARATITPGVISGLEVKDGKVLPGEAFVLCTRSNGEQIMVHFQNTTELVIDTTGTAHIIVEIAQENLDNGALNAEDGSNIGQIKRVSALPTKNFIAIASIGGGNITDKRQFISMKNILRKGITNDGLLTVENGNEVIKTIIQEGINSKDKILARNQNGDVKEITLEGVSGFLSNRETTEMEIVEIPKEITEKSFSNSIISSEGLSVDTNLNQTEDRYLKNGHTSSFYVVSTSNYKASDGLPKTYIYFNDNVYLSGMTFYCGKGVNVYVDGEEVFSSRNTGTQNIQFTERRAKVVCLEYVLTDTSSSQYISLSSFRISGKLKKHSFAAYSKLESGEYETFIKHTGSSQLSSSTSVVRDFGIVVEFPMNVTLNAVSTYSSITSEQARCTIYTEDNKKIGELAPKLGKMVAQTPIQLNKNTKYRMLLNSSENFGNGTYYYADISSSQWPFYEEKAKMMADFYKAGWINNSERNLRVYEISSIDISFHPVLVLSKNDFYRYNFVGVFENPQIGQRYSIGFVDDTIVSGFKNLKKGAWYYLSIIPGVLSLIPTKDFQKMPAGYAVSENSMKITTKGSPQHTWYGKRFMGTGDIVYSQKGTLNTRTYARIIVDSYRSEYTYMSQTESKVEHGFSESASITL